MMIDWVTTAHLHRPARGPLPDGAARRGTTLWIDALVAGWARRAGVATALLRAAHQWGRPRRRDPGQPGHLRRQPQLAAVLPPHGLHPGAGDCLARAGWPPMGDRD